MYPLLDHTLQQLRGAFPGNDVVVGFSASTDPQIYGSKAVTLRQPSISMNNSRFEGVMNIGQKTNYYDGRLEERGIHMNMSVSVKVSQRALANQIEGVEELNRMLEVVRQVFNPPLCLAFLYPVSILVTDDDVRYGYQVGHAHQFHVSNMGETPDGWWSFSTSKSDKSDNIKPPEGLKIDLSVGPFIQYIDDATES